jgi:hypothetical protein
VLTPLDDTLRHVLATTFDHAGTSDPRFFDRYWFAIYDPEGTDLALNTGMCSYLNMNVIDGYAAMIQDGRQHNVRVAGALRPQLFESPAEVTSVGPLRAEVIEPFRNLRLTLDGGRDDGMAFDLEWTATLAPHEEDQHFSRIRGRVNQDYRRYNQSGRVDGWIELGGRRTEVRDWWGGRDHSWGVRTDVAGGEPVTGPEEPRNGRSGFLWTWLIFGTADAGGYVQLQELPDGSAIHSEGMIRWADGAQIVSKEVSLDFDLLPGTRRFAEATWTLHRASGPGAGDWTLRVRPISRSLSMLGLGYSMGYADGRGFGVWRGDEHVESDTYDVSHDEDVVLPDGTVDRPYHRDCAVLVEVTAPDGTVTTGAGHAAILPTGVLPLRGLE